MGMYVSLTSVIGKTQNEVVNSLAKYANSVGGGLEEEKLSISNHNCCIIKESNGNTTIFNPYRYVEWEKSSEFISKDLNAPAFSFHIHDGDLWMYVLFVNGINVDQFNPIPDYWDDNISKEEIESWKGSATTISKYINGLKVTDIEKYLVRWDLDEKEMKKAYEKDEYKAEDWQLIDFMKAIKVPFPLTNNGEPNGQTYKLRTEQLRDQRNPLNTSKKPWWKFW